MTLTALADRIVHVPRAHDPRAAEDIGDLFSGDVSGPALELLTGTAGCSGYLSTLMRREADWLRSALAEPPEASMAAILLDMAPDAGAALRSTLRRGKRRAALLIALSDLGGVWSLSEVTGHLTALADRAVSLALEAHVSAAIGKGRLPGCGPDRIEDAAGMFVLAMGKMGAGELNYSSDIDLIVFFDEASHDPADYAELRAEFIRITQRVVKALSEVTGDGYVFRTDLRLRPDPSVTPVCIATDPAERYYESLGRTWERAAYIKARPCAGAIASAEAFLDRLKPFVWRRHLDYAAIQDAHDMRERIRRHKGLTGPLVVEGHDLKLGEGGIREIEFFTQTRQLIVGGRDPDLRSRRTLDAMQALEAKGWIEPETRTELSDAYVAHRTLEHRLQMLDDAQTHRFPTGREAMQRLVDFVGAGSIEGFEDMLRARLEQVHALTEPFFLQERAHSMDRRVVLDEIFAQPDQARALMRAWRRLPALRSERSRRLFARLEPELLSRMGAAADPDLALSAFDSFLSGLPAGVQLFSLLDANAPLLDLLVDICSTTPELARYLGRNSGVFDAVISPDFYTSLPGTDALRSQLAEAVAAVDDYESALNAARIWMKERHFRIGVHLLRGIVDPAEAASGYSAVAETVLQVLFPVVTAEFSRRHGPPPGAGAVIVALGKLGSREMTVSSDLDLIVIYNAESTEMSEGRRPLAASVYYARLTQALIAALSAPTAEGILYKVDMRLRPSGRQGPVATSLASFRVYQAKEAWTWEHMALTRARVVAGPEPLRADVSAAIADVVALRHPAKRVLPDARNMRRRLAEAFEEAAADPWEVKHGPGRMLDIEILAQAGALIEDLAGVHRPRRMLDRLASNGWLDPRDAGTLGAAHERLSALQQVGRLASDHTMDPREGGEGLVRRVLSVTGSNDIDGLETRLADDAKACDAIISRRLDAV